jgi:hypothetical protein
MFAWLRLLTEFLWTVIREWSVIGTGTFVATSMLLWNHFTNSRNIPKSAIYAVAALTLFLACFLAWSTERKKTTFSLRMNIDNASTGDQPPSSSPPQAALIITVSLRNIGPPTICEGWWVEITPVNGTKFVPRLYALTPSVSIELSAGREIHYGEADALYTKTGTPIPTGGMVRGVLLARIPGVAATIREPGTKIRVFCDDVSGKTHHAEYTMTGINQEPVYLPGMSKPDEWMSPPTSR